MAVDRLKQIEFAFEDTGTESLLELFTAFGRAVSLRDDVARAALRDRMHVLEAQLQLVELRISRGLLPDGSMPVEAARRRKAG